MDDIILFRIAERLTLTTVVLLVALVVMVGFWRSVQKIDLSDSGKLGIGGSFIFSTPVFVLLAIIGYSWVSLEHPIQIAPSADAPIQTASVEASPGGFIGASSGAVSGTEDTGYDQAITQRRLRSLNCLLQDRTPSNRTADDVAAVKLGLMRALWDADWGDPEAFADWALGRSLTPPPEAAKTVWEEVHTLC